MGQRREGDHVKQCGSRGRQPVGMAEDRSPGGQEAQHDSCGKKE